jgi:hypothetical protein
MSTKTTKTMSELLRNELSRAPSMRAIETATGLKRQSLFKFVRREQSLRLDLADKLATYFGITCRKGR